MADRSTYRQQYQNRVAELGTDDEGKTTIDELEVQHARQLLLDDREGLVDDQDVLDKAREVIERFEAQQVAIRKVQLVVCDHAQDAADALDLMEHLGIAPQQPLLPMRVFFSPTTLPDTTHSPLRRHPVVGFLEQT